MTRYRAARCGVPFASLSFAVWAVLGSASAFAQAGPEPARETDTGIEVLTVLGHRQEVANIPASVVVLDPRRIEDRRVQTIDDLAPLVPGLFVINDQDPGTNIVNLRGVTTDRLQQPAVAYVLNGVPLGDTEFFTAPLFDLERVEVARGPQGAAFGKNAAGGVLSFRTRDPSFSAPDGFLRLALGNGGFFEAEAAAGGQIGAGFGLRVAGLFRSANGFIFNEFLERKTDFFDNGALRVTLTRDLGAWRLAARAQWLDEQGGAAFISSGDVTGDFGGRLAGAALTNPIGDFPGHADRRWGHYALEATRESEKFTVSLHYAHDDYSKNFEEELDFRNGPVSLFGLPLFPDGIQPIRQPVNLDVETFEARIASPGNGTRLDWRAGLFVQDVARIRIDDFGPLQFGSPAPRFDVHSTQFGIFGGFDLAILTDRSLVFAADLRYDRDARSQTINSTADGGLIDDRQDIFERAQPKLSLAWRPLGAAADRPVIYATWGEAFRTGGFNPLPDADDIFAASFAPEIARSLELGGRARFRGFRLDGALYATNVTNYQNFTFLDGRSITLSVDRVRIRGLEISALSPKSRGFRFEAAFALVNARIAEFVSPDPLIPGATRNSSGARVPNVPEFTGTFGAIWQKNLGAGELTLRADANLIGRVVFELDNVLHTPTRATLDLRGEYGRGKVSLALWSKNATDSRSAISAFGQGQLPLLQGLGPNGPFDSFTLSRGRTFGAELIARY